MCPYVKRAKTIMMRFAGGGRRLLEDFLLSVLIFCIFSVWIYSLLAVTIICFRCGLYTICIISVLKCRPVLVYVSLVLCSELDHAGMWRSLSPREGGEFVHARIGRQHWVFCWWSPEATKRFPSVRVEILV